MQQALNRHLRSKYWMSALAAAVGSLGLCLPLAEAAAADPAVQHMERVARDLMQAAKTRSPSAMQAAVARHGDVAQIGLYALGDYRPRLESTDRDAYLGGMTRFIGRYAANEAPKYPVVKVSFAQESRRAKYGLMVDSTITLEDGTNYEVAWMLTKVGSGYRVRDAQALGLWMTPFLKKLFEDYISQNSGNVKALVAVLQRH
jgi:phospholipid transport system substrate-binding protein